MKRFIVLIQSGTPEQDLAFKEFLKPDHLLWWHWIAGSWLVIDQSGGLTSGKLLNKLADTYPGLDTMVFEIPHGDTWSGYGPTKPPESFFSWIREYWDKG